MLLTMADFLPLQTIVERLPIRLGDRSRAVEDRAVLHHLSRARNQQMGQGDVLRLMAYIVEARPTGETLHADGTCGGGVNCRPCGAEQNDMYIALADSASKHACAGMVADMIPHVRPTASTLEHLQNTRGRPVRITGQLFLDSRHHTRPCHDTQHPADPPRVSLWEMHPVSGVEVCTAQGPADCQDPNAAVWKPLDAWVHP